MHTAANETRGCSRGVSAALAGILLVTWASLGADELDATMSPMGKAGEANVPCAECTSDERSDPYPLSGRPAVDRSAPDYAEAGHPVGPDDTQMSPGADLRPGASLPVDSGALLPGGAK